MSVFLTSSSSSPPSFLVGFFLPFPFLFSSFLVFFFSFLFYIFRLFSLPDLPTPWGLTSVASIAWLTFVAVHLDYGLTFVASFPSLEFFPLRELFEG